MLWLFVQLITTLLIRLHLIRITGKINTYLSAGAILEKLLISLHREMKITQIWPEWKDKQTLSLHWRAEHRLRNRRLRLWSAWRPWEPPREYAVPDEVRPEQPDDPPGSGVFTLPEPISFGPYWIAFRTAPSWEPLEAPAMPKGNITLLTVSKEATRQRQQTIQDHWEDEKLSSFLAAFERACIFHLMGIEALRDREIETALTELTYGAPQEIITLYRCLHHFNIGLSPRLRTLMYRPETLKKLYDGDVSREVENAYLADLTKISMLEVESALLLLRHSQNSEVWAFAIETLLRRTEPDDIETLVELVAAGYLADEMVLELWETLPDTAILKLNALPSDPVRDRLLRKMALQTKSTKVIRPGIWVRTKAGWGQLIEILSNGEQIPYLITDAQGELPGNPILKVALPRKDRTWYLKIDNGAKRIHFEGANQVWLCLKNNCPGFVSVNLSEVENEHNRVAHDGRGPSFKQIASSWRYYKPLIFSWEKQNPYS